MKKVTMAVLSFFLLTATAPVQADVVGPPSVDIVIDVGHGGVDGGASYGVLLEKDINLQIGKFLYKELTESGYHVILNRSEDRALSDDNQWLQSPSRHKKDLAQRKNLAAEVSPKIMVSLHTNWSADPTQRGPLVLYQKNNQSFMLADIVQHTLNRYYQTNAEPRMGKSYYLLKHSICPTLIVEMGYISNRADRNMMIIDKNQKDIAHAIRIAIDEYFLLTNPLVSSQQEKAAWSEYIKSLIRRLMKGNSW